MRIWSEHQKRIFDFVATGSGNAIIEAVAGSGKTTTIKEALQYTTGSSIFLAFNKSIAEELKKAGINARTYHSLTCSAVLRYRGGKMDANKVKTITKNYLANLERQEDTEYRKLYQGFCVRLVGLAKNAGLGLFTDSTFENWLELVEHHDLQLESELAQLSKGITLAMKILDLSNESSDVDYDDMLYFSVLDQLNLQKFDFVFVDEAQDTNAIQRAVLKKIMHKNSRLVAVGDPSQAIYGFRGADAESMNLIANDFACTKLPLTVTYRCPLKVVEVARQWCDHLEAAPCAPIGVVESVTDWTYGSFQSQDLVVCRTTKPLIKLGYTLMKNKKPFFIMGKDIGQGLKTLIRGFEPRNIADLEKKLETWRVNEVAKALKKDNDSKAEAINDKAECVQFLIDSLFDSSLYSLEQVIDDMFANKENATVLATVHKAKGLEADRVWWLNSSQCPSKWAKQPWQQQQEANICYVAATRAKKELLFIEEEVEQF